MPSLEVCLTPELISLHSPEGKNVVVVDILRATSCMVTGLSEGVKAITPVSSVEECSELGKKGYLTAGERGGIKIESFDLGNSPLSYLEEDYSGRDLAMTTTNGTMAIERAKSADQLFIGAFLNLTALTDHLRNQDQDLVILCAGWKGKVSFEDTLFAGALCDNLKTHYEVPCDAAVISMSLFNQSDDNLLEAIQASSHYQRLKRLNIEKDFEFCVSVDRYRTIPYLDHGVIVPLLQEA